MVTTTLNQVNETNQSKPILWVGRVLWVLTVPFMIMDIGMHLLKPPFVIEASEKMGFDTSILLPLGIVELVFMALYLYKKTALWGMVGWTAFFGGAVAAHLLLMKDSPVFPIVFAVLMWASLLCRDQELARRLGFGKLVGGQGV